MNPYAASLGDRDPVASLSEVPARIRAVVAAIGPSGLSRSHAPGKWTVHQQLVHLAQVEMAFGVRIRMALSMDGYVAQPFDQDVWMQRETALDAAAALAAYEAMRAMNLALFRSLTPEQRRARFHHPERGESIVEETLAVMAGHERHHLGQLEVVAASL